MFASLSDSLSELVGQYELLASAQEEFNESGVLSASTLGSIASKFPELQGSIDAYIMGMISAKDLLGELSDAYGTDVDNYKAAMWAKTVAGDEFLDDIVTPYSFFELPYGRSAFYTLFYMRFLPLGTSFA